jgi:hypothetical protein
MPAAGTCGSVDYTGALGPNTFNITGMTWCRRSTGDVHLISGGVVGGGVYTGQVTAGARRGNDLGLQIRTPFGLIDVYGALTQVGANPLHATGSSSPGMVQLMPEDAGVTVTFPGTRTDAAAAGCAAPGLGTGHTFHAAAAPTHFPGTLDVQNNVAECQTDTTGGVVEPTSDGGNGDQQCSPVNANDPNATRTVLYAISTPTGPKMFRGLILSSTFTGTGASRVYGLTLLLEENITHLDACPVNPTFKNLVDDPGQSFTVVRLMVTAAGTSSAITFAR